MSGSGAGSAGVASALELELATALAVGVGVGTTVGARFGAGGSVAGEGGVADGSLAVAGATTGRTTSTPRSRAAIRRYMPATVAAQATDAYGPLVPFEPRHPVRGTTSPIRSGPHLRRSCPKPESAADHERIHPNE